MITLWLGDYTGLGSGVNAIRHVPGSNIARQGPYSGAGGRQQTFSGRSTSPLKCLRRSFPDPLCDDKSQHEGEAHQHRHHC